MRSLSTNIDDVTFSHIHFLKFTCEFIVYFYFVAYNANILL